MVVSSVTGLELLDLGSDQVLVLVVLYMLAESKIC